VRVSVITALVVAHCTLPPFGSLQNWPNAPNTKPGGARGSVGCGVGTVGGTEGLFQTGKVGGGASVGDLQIGKEGGGVGPVGAAVVGIVGTGVVGAMGDGLGILDGTAVVGN